MLNISGKRILVTGITGTLGERLAKRLIKDGTEEVRGLIRDQKDANNLIESGINPYLGELTDRQSLIRATHNIDIIIHCAAYLGNDLDEAINSNVTGVDNLASVSLDTNVKRFVHISTVSVYGEPIKGFFDETSPIVQNHNEVYVHTKAKSEWILNTYIEKGLDINILRPGVICSEQNSYWGDKQVNRMLETEVVDWVHPEDIVPWIHADNLVEMICLVLAKGVRGQVYNAIDGNFAEEDFRVRLISVLGRKLKIPNRTKECPIYSNAKIQELGYKPLRTFKQTVSNLERMAISQL